MTRPDHTTATDWRALSRASVLIGLLLVSIGALGCASTGSSASETVAADDAVSVGSLSDMERARLLLTTSLPLVDGCTVRTDAPPPFQTLADSAAIARAIGQVWAARSAPSGTVVLSVGADSTASVSSVAILESDLPEELTELVSPLLEGRLKTVTRETASGHRARGWSHRLRIELNADQPSFQVGHSLYCTPLLLNPEEVRRHLHRQTAARQDIVPSRGSRYTTLVWFLVDEDGLPSNIRVRRSSGIADLDRVATEAARHARYRPASRDGIFVTVVLSLPIVHLGL